MALPLGHRIAYIYGHCLPLETPKELHIAHHCDLLNLDLLGPNHWPEFRLPQRENLLRGYQVLCASPLSFKTLYPAITHI